MGREAKLRVADGSQKAEARVHLDSEMLTIGPPFRLKIALTEVAAVAVAEDGLHLASSDAALTLKLSAKEAAAWAKAILNPPSLATKLGLKEGMRIAVLGKLPREVDAALAPHKPIKAKRGAPMDAVLTFVAVPAGVPVKELASLAAALPAKSAVWLIYEKGAAMTGDALIYAARAAGLKDTKVAKISETHTGLRFIPAT
ncbi:hypothetical protein sos41_39970 [Alphaproteobacteria bacterium SO-S41]|nr:hypothetical protein sos41_39970 [Alphaproteobacteria bacterium SO-S41]